MKKKKKDEDEFSFRPFEVLKHHFGKGAKSVAAPPAPTREKGPPTDDETFHNAMREVRKIPEYAELPVRKKSVRPRFSKGVSERDAVRELREITSGITPLDLPATQEYVAWLNPAFCGQYGQDLPDRLHAGRFSVKDYIDLHGYTAEEAEEELKDFMKKAGQLGMHCVKIIHGRGLRSPSGPVLKNMIVRLLMSKYRKRIIAFASAPRCDGGLGAIYILLRK